MTDIKLTSIFVQETGPEDAPTIVFLHGGGAGGWMWKPQLDRLTDYHCLVPDLPEQGKSLEAGLFTHRGSAELVAELIRKRAHGGKAHVVGMSEGAQVGVALLALSPEVALSAVISSAVLRPLAGQSFYSAGLLSASYKLFVAPLKNSGWWIKLNMQYAAGLPEEYYPQFSEVFREQTEGSFVHILYEGLHFRLPPGLDKANVPVLVVAGKHEYKQMRQSVQDLVSALPDARGCLVSIDKNLRKEHNWCIYAPDLFANTVRGWIDRQAVPEALEPV
jgi:pimeloyl-ACP methyl ester carboxylesterase